MHPGGLHPRNDRPVTTRKHPLKHKFYMFEGVIWNVGQVRQPFSMMSVRKSVMSMPAARTILGTRDALVMPGMVLTSRK